MSILETIFGILLCLGAGWFCYMSFHVVEENKKGKFIPLPWEKKRDVFDKSDVEYRDGDNT